MLTFQDFASPPEGANKPVALGAMNFGKRTPAAESEKILALAASRGVRLVDTANVYGDGVSEEIVGKFLKAHPGKMLVATKVGLFGLFQGKAEGLSRQTITSAADRSLARLGTDAIDLYYLHAPDHSTPLEDTLSGIRDLFEKGKIRAFGVSNYASWQIVEMCHLCDRHSMPRPIVAQQLYNLLIRQLDIEYARFAKKYGVHTTVYNALAGGLLSGRHRKDAPVEQGSRFDRNKMYLGRYWNERTFDLVETYRALADGAGMSLVDFAYAWLAGAPLVDSILVGPATAVQLDAALSAVEKKLSPETRAEVDQIHRAAMGTDTYYAR